MASDTSLGMSRQHPQAQQHRVARTEKLRSVVEEKEEGRRQCESRGGAAGSGMDEEVRGHPYCPTPDYSPQFTSQSPKSSSATSLWSLPQRYS